MIQISKAEREKLRRLFPALRVVRTKSGKYWLCEESRYLRCLPENEQAQISLADNMPCEKAAKT